MTLTVSSPRTDLVLQLVAAYHTSHKETWPTPGQLWVPIVRFIEDASVTVLVSYFMAGLDSAHPNHQFMGDVQQLIKSGFLVLQENQRLELTPTGSALIAIQRVQKTYEPLLRLIEKAA